MNLLRLLLQSTMNMSRFNNFLIFAVAVLMSASCGSKAGIDGTVSDAPSSEVIVKLLNINRYEVLDTIRTDASGRYSYKVPVEKGQPEFVYIFYKDTKVASLLLDAGDVVKVESDTLGNFSVTGSEESVKLAQVEKDYASALTTMSSIASKMEGASDDAVAQLRRELGQAYVNYYRDRVKYVMENLNSLTIVPVFFQNFGADLPVFAQSTDAIHFTKAADSLERVYPESRYVKALRAEAKRRYGYLEIAARLGSATEIGYPDIELPDVKAETCRLSSVDSKVVMIYFWSASDAAQKMFNLDFLKGIYEDYHEKGFEIYQVALDPDKAAWARVVKEQNLPWINVCDSRGSASPYVMTYNIGALPAAFLISEGELVDGQIVDDKSLRRLLDKLTR